MAIRFNARTNSIETDASSIAFTQPITTPASTTSLAGLNIAEGVAPSAPVDGDVWVTAAGAFNARLNGATVDLAGSGTTNLTWTASTRTLASDTGTDAVITLFTSTEAGLAPLSGGGTTNFLRADGTWATPAGGGTIGGTIADNQVAVGNGSDAIDGSANLTYDATTLTISSGTVPSAPNLELTSTRPVLVFDESDAAADNGRWYMHASAETFELVAINDANSASEAAFTVNRTGTTIDSVAFNGAISGDSFSGDGSALTALTAANVSSGNLGSGVLPYITADGAASAYQMVFANTTGATSGNFGLLMENATANFTYNPSTNILEIGNMEYGDGVINHPGTIVIQESAAGDDFIVMNSSSSVDFFYNGIMTTRAGGFGAGTLSIIEGDVAGDAGARILYFTDSGNAIKASITSGSNSGDFVIDNNVANKDVVITTSGTGKVLSSAVTRVEADDAATAALVSVLEVSATSTGTPAAGFGPSLDFYAETAAGFPGNQELVGKIGVEMTSVTAAAETGELVFYTMDLGGAAEERWAMTGTAGGQSQLIGGSSIALYSQSNQVLNYVGQTEIFYSGTRRFRTAVGGDIDLFSDGNTSTEGRAINFVYQNGTVAAELGHRATARFDLRNHLDGGGLLFTADDSGGTERTILNGDPDGVTILRGDTNLELEVNAGENALIATANGATDLYYDNIKRLGTDASGAVAIYSDGNTDGEIRVLNFDRQDGTQRAQVGYATAGSTFYIRNQVHGAPIGMYAEDVGGAQRPIISGDPDADTDVTGDVNITLWNAAGVDRVLEGLANSTTTIYYNGTATLQTADRTAAGNSSGADVLDGAGTFRPIGFNNTPQDTNNATNVPFTQAQVGYDIIHDNVTAYTWTTEASTGTAQTDIPAGSMWKCTNLGSGVITIAAGSGVTMYWLDGSGTTGNRSLAQWGTCTLYKYSNTQYHIWGTGLS